MLRIAKVAKFDINYSLRTDCTEFKHFWLEQAASSLPSSPFVRRLDVAAFSFAPEILSYSAGVTLAADGGDANFDKRKRIFEGILSSWLLQSWGVQTTTIQNPATGQQWDLSKQTQ